MASFGNTLQVGGLRMAEVCSSPDGVEHPMPATENPDEALFFLVLQLEGSSIHRQDERDAKLSPGDFTICASTRPYEMTRPVPGRCLVIVIPDNLMRRHLACPDDVVAVRMAGNRGMTGVLSDFIKSFWGCRADAADPAVALRMSYTLLDLIAAAYSVSLMRATSSRRSSPLIACESFLISKRICAIRTSTRRPWREPVK